MRHAARTDNGGAASEAADGAAPGGRTPSWVVDLEGVMRSEFRRREMESLTSSLGALIELRNARR